MCWSTSRSRGGEQVELGLGLRRRAGEGVQHEAGQARREDRVALVHAPHGVGQLRRRDVLGHVAARAGADHGDHVLGGVGHRQRQEQVGRGPRGGARGSPRRRRRPACARRAARRRARARRSPPRPPRPCRPRRGSRAAAPARRARPTRNSWWSSTITTRGSLIAALQHQLDLGAAAGRAGDARAAAVALHAPDDRLAHAAAVGRARPPGRSPARGRARTPAARPARTRRRRRRSSRRRTWPRWSSPRAPRRPPPRRRRRARGRRPPPPRPARRGAPRRRPPRPRAPGPAARPGPGAGRPASHARSSRSWRRASAATSLRVVGALHQRERLQHRVVQVRGHLGALLRADPLARAPR